MKRFLAGFLILLFAAAVPAAPPDHAAWNTLLKKHVVPQRGGQATLVDYAGMRADRSRLKVYLGSLSSVTPAEFDAWPRADRLAFLINAYNAWTVELILTGAPDLVSIKDLGSFLQSPWKRSFIPLLGHTRSLDDIEHGMIRAADGYREPRIHFAVNCASIGCPALRSEAYRGDRLDFQLEDATRKFLSDRQRNRLQGNELAVSSIFKWYREDFEKGWGGVTSLPQFLSRYRSSLGLTDHQMAMLLHDKMEIVYLDYDWRLNRKY